LTALSAAFRSTTGATEISHQLAATHKSAAIGHRRKVDAGCPAAQVGRCDLREPARKMRAPVAGALIQCSISSKPKSAGASERHAERNAGGAAN
jgi:hypothetical protein